MQLIVAMKGVPHGIIGRLPLFLAAFVNFGTAQARETVGPYHAELIRVVDGDTVKVRVKTWIDHEVIASVRIKGIDAPELYRPKMRR